MIIAITGGRDRTPTLAELELARPHIEAADTMREGEARGTDKAVAAWVRARGLAHVEPFPADWDAFKARPGKNPAGPIRNRLMLKGEEPSQLELGADVVEGPRVGRVGELVAFAGNDGTKDCHDQADALRIPVVDIAPVDEPRPWNRHHGPRPSPRSTSAGDPCSATPGRSSPAKIGKLQLLESSGSIAAGCGRGSARAVSPTHGWSSNSTRSRTSTTSCVRAGRGRAMRKWWSARGDGGGCASGSARTRPGRC